MEDERSSRRASSCSLGNKEIAWWLVSTNIEFPWRFLPKCGSGLARVWIGSCRIVTFSVFGHNQEGLIARHIACN